MYKTVSVDSEYVRREGVRTFLPVSGRGTNDPPTPTLFDHLSSGIFVT